MSALKILGTPTYNYITTLYTFYPAWYIYLIRAVDDNKALRQMIKESFSYLPPIASTHTIAEINPFEIKMCVNRGYLNSSRIEIGNSYVE